MKRALGRIGGEDGFSVFEVVIASSILFFAITALLGLVATTTDMGINARRRNLVTNVIASRMERYRSLPFARIALSPAGDILPNETITKERFTVTVNTQVRDLSAVTKEIRITATVTTADRPPVTTVASTYVRDRDIDFTAAAATGMTLRWGPSTPAKNTVVFSNEVVGGGAGSLRLHVIAQCSDLSDSITYMSIKSVEGSSSPLRDSPFPSAQFAVWDNFPGTASSREQYFTWNTRSVEPTIQDGWQTVEFIAENQKGDPFRIQRRFYVDNFPPDTPASLVATVPTSDVLNRLGWNRCIDGGPLSFAAWYDLEVWELATDSEALPPTSTVYQQITVSSKDVPTTGFSRYHAAVKSVSTRGLTQGVRALSPQPFVSRPLASGESSYSSILVGPTRIDSTNARFGVETPRFPVDGKVVYRLYRRRGGAAGSETQVPAATRELTPTVAYTYTDYVSTMGSKQVPYQPYYYLVSAEFKALGYGSTGTSQTVWSNRLGPTSGISGGWTSMPVEGW